MHNFPLQVPIVQHGRMVVRCVADTDIADTGIAGTDVRHCADIRIKVYHWYLHDTYI